VVKRADGGIEGVRMCRINSGKFGVEWERTEKVLEGIEVAGGWMGVVEVWDPET
jgi:ADP-ribose 1''-phosphate phosphatase